MTTATYAWYSTRELTIALAEGILAADPFFAGYEPPPGFERVLRDFGKGFEAMENEDGCFEIHEPDELRRNILDFVRRHPICKGWNSWDDATDKTIKFLHRYSPRPKRREFIDLDAIEQNTWFALNRNRRERLGTA